jgi:hypothetical protein
MHAKTAGAQARVLNARENHQDMEGLHIDCILGVRFGVDGWAAWVFEMGVYRSFIVGGYMGGMRL